MAKPLITVDSKPYYSMFSPDVIPYQRKVCDLVDSFDYSQNNLEILLSGSFGSAKSILMAHLGVRHAAEHPGACVAICRRGLPDLKKTIWLEILNHMEEDFIEGEDYHVNRSEMTITFENGSQVICCSWADKRYKKFRSLKLSMIIIEEIVENSEEDEEAFKQLKARLRRIPEVKENILIAATNPDQPGHWVYRHFIEGSEKYSNRYVFYSRTEDNPFLDQAYIRELRRDMSPKEARRYLDGEWIEIRGEVVYYEYSKEEQFRKKLYEVNSRYPIICSWDFNIGAGKPMSMCLLQYIEDKDECHFFGEVVIEGARTADTVDELDSRGLLKKDWKYVITGDASGKHRDTRSSKSDYEILQKEFSNRDLQFEYAVPMSNPPVRTRHNRVNAYHHNALGQRRVFLYEGCKTLDEGFRLVKLKEGSQYIEDDSKTYQHVTTAAGYAIMVMSQRAMRKPQGTVLL